MGIKSNKVKYNDVFGSYIEKEIPRCNLRTHKDLCNTRDLNIIVHGVDEDERGDDIFLKELFAIMEMDTGPRIGHRLGKRNEDRARPIKIVMVSKTHKDEFMSKLWKLKYAGPVHNKARITDDHTWEERMEIRRWVKMAEEKNEKDNVGMKNFVWKVRGSPKSGLRIVQIRR